MNKCFNCENEGTPILRPTYAEHIDQECCFQWCNWMDYICKKCDKRFSRNLEKFEKAYREYHRKNNHQSVNLI